MEKSQKINRKIVRKMWKELLEILDENEEAGVQLFSEDAYFEVIDCIKAAEILEISSSFQDFKQESSGASV